MFAGKSLRRLQSSAEIEHRKKTYSNLFVLTYFKFYFSIRNSVFSDTSSKGTIKSEWASKNKDSVCGSSSYAASFKKLKDFNLKIVVVEATQFWGTVKIACLEQI